MPAFKYICEACGLLFEALRPEKQDAVPCRRCTKPARLKLAGLSSTFAHTPTGPVPQNTGASSVDHDVDLIVARSATQNRRIIGKRVDDKLRLMHRHEVAGNHLSRWRDGQDDFYWVKNPAQQQQSDENRAVAHSTSATLHQLALQKRRK